MKRIVLYPIPQIHKMSDHKFAYFHITIYPSCNSTSFPCVTPNKSPLPIEILDVFITSFYDIIALFMMYFLDLLLEPVFGKFHIPLYNKEQFFPVQCNTIEGIQDYLKDGGDPNPVRVLIYIELCFALLKVLTFVCVVYFMLVIVMVFVGSIGQPFNTGWALFQNAKSLAHSYSKKALPIITVSYILNNNIEYIYPGLEIFPYALYSTARVSTFITLLVLMVLLDDDNVINQCLAEIYKEWTKEEEWIEELEGVFVLSSYDWTGSRYVKLRLGESKRKKEMGPSIADVLKLNEVWDCPICTEPIEGIQGHMHLLRCGHKMHTSCYRNYVKSTPCPTRHCCPYCRKKTTSFYVIKQPDSTWKRWNGDTAFSLDDFVHDDPICRTSY